MMKMKKFAAMTAALLICSGTMGYMPEGTLKIGSFTANAAGDAVAESVEINEVNFPDDNFRQYVAEKFDTDGDGVLSTEEIAAVTQLDIDHKDIADLTGIEHFTALNLLYCMSNNIKSLDVSKNTALTGLYCQYNQLTNLKLNEKIKELNCSDNKLTNLDTSTSVYLNFLACANNQLTNLEISNNTKLTELNCCENKLTSLDVSQNKELVFLCCTYNQLTTLDVNKNVNLSYLNCYENQIEVLDVSKNVALEALWCYKNKLTTLDLSNNTALKDLNCHGNQLTSLDLNENINLEVINSFNNIYRIELTDGKFDLSTLPTGFDITKASEWTNGTVKDNILTVEDISKEVTYQYDCGLKAIETFTLKPPFELPAGSVEINEANFPDANFCEYVKENFDTDGDGVLSAEEIEAVTEIILSEDGMHGMTIEVSDLKGIEYFTNLEVLNCNNSNLTEIVLSKNTKLKYLECEGNALTSLDISKNTALISLSCSENKLTSIDVSQNAELIALFCLGNQLTNLDVSCNAELEHLNCSYNQLTNIDVSNNTKLMRLNCSENQITALDVTNNPEIDVLICSYNQLSEIDISNNKKLALFECSGNNLTSLDLCSPILSECDFSKNTYKITLTDNTFDLSTLPTGFDVTKASEWTNGTVEGNILTVEDASKEVTYKYDCGYDTYVTFTLISASSADTSNAVAIDATNFPDENFRKFVKKYYDKDGDGVLSTEEIEPVTEMTLFDYISHSKIEVSDLKGIEYFTSLELLDCHTQNIKELDLSRNTSLKYLYCGSNELTTLDLSNNTALVKLNCDNNQLTELDLSNNTELLMLCCNENQLATLNVSKNTMLNRLECIKNQLTTIDTSNNTNLQTLMCDENQLTTIDISNNTLLDYLSCNQNQLTTIDISKNEELDFLKCNNNQLTSIDTNNRSLSLEIFDNTYEIALTNNTFDLSTLPGGFDVTKASGWTNGTVEGNILTVIDDSKYVTYDYNCGKGITLSFSLFTQNCTEKPNTETNDVKIDNINFPDKVFRQYLTENFDADKNGTLSYSEAMSVTGIFISESGISDLTGLQYFKNLQTLGCSDNDLTQLDISENKALTHLYCDNNNLTSLDTSNNPFLYVLFCQYNNLTNLDVRNNTELLVLWCSDNQLTTLDVSKNTALKDLGCDNNQLTSLDLSNNKVLTGDEIVFATHNNKYKINLTDNTFDLSTLPAGFDITKASEWTNGTVKDNILTVEDASKEVTYKYDCGHETIEIFTLIPTDEPVTPPTQEIKVTLKGDANCDGKVTIADATAILQSLGNPDKYNLSAQGEKNADVTGNDGVMPSDAVMIQAYDAKMIDEL